MLGVRGLGQGVKGLWPGGKGIMPRGNGGYAKKSTKG